VSHGARRARVSGLTVALVVVSLLGAAALALPGVVQKPRKVVLTVSQKGTVAGLYPGRTATVTVVVRNGSRKTVRLKSVSATAKALPGCPASMLQVRSVASKKVLKPRKSLTVALPAQLARTAPDACQGRTFRLALSATGTQVR
jgi:hypothetical protein